MTQVTAHWTTVESARRIREEGVRIKQTSIDSKWGQGFYTSTRPRPEYGEEGVRVAIRLLNPLVTNDEFLAQEYIDELLSEAQSDDAREVLRAAGYDGVVIHWDSGEMWVIAFENEQVKVIRET